jgi:hypothetical protein
MTNGRSLPDGWWWDRRERRVITDKGVKVPLTSHPSAASTEELEAYQELREFEQSRRTGK